MLPDCHYLTAAAGRRAARLPRRRGPGRGHRPTGREPAGRAAEPADRPPRCRRSAHSDIDGDAAVRPAGRGDRLADVAVNIHRLADGSAAVHLVNYAYDRDDDRVVPRTGVRLTVPLPGSPTSATLVTADGERTELRSRRTSGGAPSTWPSCRSTPRRLPRRRLSPAAAPSDRERTEDRYEDRRADAGRAHSRSCEAATVPRSRRDEVLVRWPPAGCAPPSWTSWDGPGRLALPALSRARGQRHRRGAGAGGAAPCRRATGSASG